jgi:hypothetical protein
MSAIDHSLEQPHFSAPLKWAAKIISIVFHPLFIPLWLLLFMQYWFPVWFSGMAGKRKIFFTLSVVFSTTILPGITVLLLKGLGFINSIELRTQKERIIPYIATMFFYWWSYNVSRNIGDIPTALRVLFLGMFLATVIALVANSFFKISMHALGVGGMVACLLVLAFQSRQPMGLGLCVGCLVAGLVCTARFIAGEHTAKEMSIGFVAGAICQAIAYWWVY